MRLLFRSRRFRAMSAITAISWRPRLRYPSGTYTPSRLLFPITCDVGDRGDLISRAAQNRGPRRARFWLGGVEIRHATNCHRERPATAGAPSKRAFCLVSEHPLQFVSGHPVKDVMNLNTLFACWGGCRESNDLNRRSPLHPPPGLFHLFVANKSICSIRPKRDPRVIQGSPRRLARITLG